RKAGPARPAARPAAPPRAPFVLLVCGLLGGALVSLLLLNTVLAEDAISMTQLQRSTKLLEQQRQAYQSDIAREESPENLARKAEALGMKRPESLLFVDYNGRPTDSRSMRQVPHAAAAAAGAAGVVGIPGAVVPGDGVPSAPGRGTEAARP
ncbi:hypothetical protein, partial [Actinomadura kijaniata]|uniref:hypothetical protein n=1 Tax=Actinomadura kijaniata TaxID=46161 RepID=UPI000829E40C